MVVRLFPGVLEDSVLNSRGGKTNPVTLKVRDERKNHVFSLNPRLPHLSIAQYPLLASNIELFTNEG